MRVVSAIILAIGLIFTIPAWSQAEGQFSVSAIAKKIQSLKKSLQKNSQDIVSMQAGVAELETIRKQALICVENANDDIEQYKDQISKLVVETTGEEVAKEQVYLKAKIKQSTEIRGDCNILVLQSEEVLQSYSDKLSDALSSLRFQSTTPVWIIASSLPSIIAAAPGYISTEAFIATTGTKILSLVPLILVSFTILTALIMWYAINRVLKSKLALPPGNTLSAQYKYLALLILKKYTLPFILLSAITLFSSLFYFLADSQPYLLLLSGSLLLYIISLMTITFFLHPPMTFTEVEYAPPELVKSLARRLRVLATLALIGFIFYVTFKNQPLSQLAWLLARTIFMTLSTLSLASIIWPVLRHTKLLAHYPIVRIVLLGTFCFAMIFLLALEWVGFHRLTDYILTSIALTVLLGFSYWVVYKTITFSLNSFTDDEFGWQAKIRYHLGVKKHRSFQEMLWIKGGLVTLLWIGSSLLLLKIWGLSTHDQVQIVDALTNGFSLFGIRVVPANIIAGLFVFSGLSIITRFLRTRIARRTGVTMERGTRNSLAAIVGYIGFAVAIIFALLVAGVNFAGLAIIAGALSVGIGFGLQNIVNNFVSGIVLLIERPIKIGDRIVVGGVDGHVTKISMRSTIIKTRERTEVIMPNAELISTQVNNLMYGDTRQRLQIVVGVAYGSDTELVHKTLMSVAKAHPDVICNDEIQPLALFNHFRDSCLEFELRIVISNVDRRQLVRSEIHFAIDKAFREANIEIAFPQMDIHLKKDD